MTCALAIAPGALRPIGRPHLEAPVRRSNRPRSSALSLPKRRAQALEMQENALLAKLFDVFP